MGCKLLRAARFGLLASVAAIGVQSSAHASTATLTDNYYGGLNTYTGLDVIGTSDFEITSATVGLTTNNLTVTINTNYAGQSGLDNTTYGSLFIGSSATWTSDHSSQSVPYPTDQYHPGEWTYAFVPNGTANNSPGSLYNVVESNVVMSNVNGDPITYPNLGNPGWYFRQGQAVAFDTTGQTALADSGNLTVNPGTYVSYSINIDAAVYNALKNGFSLSWAMTCANDIIQGVVTFPGGNDGHNPTPLPAALPLFAGGLGFLGFVGSRRRKSAAKAAVAG
jgi:hypothetical protein